MVAAAAFGVEPAASARASRSVDFPLPFFPTKKVTSVRK